MADLTSKQLVFLDLMSASDLRQEDKFDKQMEALLKSQGVKF